MTRPRVKWSVFMRRASLKMSESQWREQDWKCPRLNYDTETGSVKIWVWRRRLGKNVNTETSLRLTDICPPLSGGRGMICAPWKEFCMIYHDFWQLIGWSGFFLTNMANQIWRNELILSDLWPYLDRLNSFTLAFLGWMTQHSTRLWYFVDVETETH